MARTALFVDLDDTLINTRRVEKDLDGLAVKHGVDPKAWASSYLVVRAEGYTPGRHIMLLRQRGLISETQAQALRLAIKAWFKCMAKYLYWDTVQFVKTATDRRIALFCLSYGGPTWQADKLAGTGFGSQFTPIVNERPLVKADAILKHTDNYEQIGFIDNFAPELDVVAERMPEVKTFWMQRTGCSAALTPNGYVVRRAHRLVGDLIEVLALVR